MEHHITHISQDELEDLREAFNKIGQLFKVFKLYICKHMHMHLHIHIPKRNPAMVLAVVFHLK